MEQNNFSYAERIIIGILMTIFLIGFVSASNWGPANLVRVESNASTDYKCTGGFFAGTCLDIFDNNWGTGARSGGGSTINAFWNLTKTMPAGYNSNLRVNSSSQLKGPFNGLVNSTIPSGCYNYYSNKIQFRAYSEWSGSQAGACWDGVSIPPVYTGWPVGWNLIYAGFFGSLYMYEFHMIWSLNYSTVNLTAPMPNHGNLYVSNNSLVQFDCSAKISSQLNNIEGVTLSNVSLWTNDTGTWVLNQTNIVSGTGASTSFLNFYPNDAEFSWYCQAYSNDSDYGFSTTNGSIYVDLETPTINITSPYGVLSSVYLGQNMSLNWTLSDNFALDSCWYNYNNVNNSISCSENINPISGSTFPSIDTAPYGYNFITNQESILLRVYKYPTASATTAYLRNSAGTINLATSTFNGDVANFHYRLLPGISYQVVMDGGSTIILRSSSSFPQNIGFVNLTSGVTYVHGGQVSQMVFDDVTGTTGNKSTKIVLATPSEVTFYANDTVGNIGSFTRNWSYGILQNSITFNPTAYETSTETYVLNVTTGGPGSISATFVYNGVSYPSTMTNLGSNKYLFTNSLNLPLSDTVSYLFYWNITFNSLPFSSTIENQTVLPINFTICSGPVNTTYFNVSFRDEMTNLPMNGTMDTSTWSFSLGGNIFHNYIFSSLVEKPNYAFCFSPQYRSINLSYTLSSSASGYITRVSQGRNLILTNTTTNKLVYLISSAAAGPIIIQVLDTTSGNAISGARIIVSRDIFGTTVNVYDAFTDDSGALGVYLSSVVPYTITASRSDCGSNTKTITPVGSVTMNLNCASNVSKFVAKIDGISYQRGPLDGVVQCTGIPQTFSYYVKSVIHPLVAVKFELVDANTRSVVAINESNATTTWCNITSCMLTIDYTSYAGDNFVGRYYVNNGNGTNNTYVLLEGDSRWRCININKNNSQQSVAKFFDHFREFTNAWGSTNIRCSQYHVNDTCVAQAECKWVVTGNAAIGWNNFCMLKDDYNKAEFNKILIVFFMMVIVLFIMSRTTGYEMTNPGSFVLFMAVIIFILSYFQMFYFNGLTPWAFFDQYIYSFICLLLAGGYNLSIIRRYSA